MPRFAPGWTAPAAVTLALALAGCGSDSKDAATATTATSATRGEIAAVVDRRIADAETAVKAKPRSAQALADLAEAHYQSASLQIDPADGAYRPAGLAQLRLAASAWQRLLALNPERPDVAVASMMALAYGKSGLNEPRDAIAAQLLVTERRNDSSSYQQLAVMAYENDDLRTGDLAAARAVKLAPASNRERLRSSLRALRAGKPPSATR